MRRRRKRLDPQAGFTLLEILITLLVLLLGLGGAVALHTTATRSNRLAKDLGRAKAYAEEVMEQLRGTPVTGIAEGTWSPFVTATGQEFTPVVTSEPVAGQPNLVLVTVDVNFAVDGDEDDVATAKLEMLRTTAELL